MSEQTLEELMAQVQALWALAVRYEQMAAHEVCVTFEPGRVSCSTAPGRNGEDGEIGLGSTPREALVDLRQNLLKMANEKLAFAGKLQAMCDDIK